MWREILKKKDGTAANASATAGRDIFVSLSLVLSFMEPKLNNYSITHSIESTFSKFRYQETSKYFSVPQIGNSHKRV